VSYELVWQPRIKGWSVWSTVVDAFVAKDLPTPEAVADYIIDGKEFYFTEINGERISATCQYKTRDEIVQYFEKEIANPIMIRAQIWNKEQHRWEEEPTVSKEQLRKNLQGVYQSTLAQWDSGKIRPDPEAKRELRLRWIDRANEVKKEGIVSIGGIKLGITDEGLEYKGEAISRPEPLLPQGWESEGKKGPLYPHVPKTNQPQYPHKPKGR
jgi:hypothetical protein